MICQLEIMYLSVVGILIRPSENPQTAVSNVTGSVFVVVVAVVVVAAGADNDCGGGAVSSF